MGDFVRPQPRGQVTIPKRIRDKLGLDAGAVLNVFEEEGMIVMVPVSVEPKLLSQMKSGEMDDADWLREGVSTDEYMAAVRYTPLAKLRQKRLREG